MSELMERVKELVDKLSFDECIALYAKLESGNPLIDLLFDRMEELDQEAFEEWL